MKTYRNILKSGEQKLLAAGVENARGEAWYFFEDAFSMQRMDYLLNQSQICRETDRLAVFEMYIKRRSEEHIPMQYLLGVQEFMGLSFKVNEEVLIPRQDTEILVETVLEMTRGKRSVLDMCTGSGCIIISLAHYGTFDTCVGVDLSKEALKIAKENGKSLAPMVKFINSDLFTEIKDFYDVIVSNPPYITTGECRHLMREVKDFEPMMALDGHEDGLYFYRRIIKDAKKYLNPGGMLFFEIGYDQGKSVPALMRKEGFSEIVLKQDLAGLDRVVYGRYEGGK